MQSPHHIDADSLAELQQRFTAVVGRIEGHAHNRFHYLHGDEREEAVQEVRCIAWRMYRQLFLEGRNPDELVGGIAKFAVKQVLSGGRLVGQNPVNDVMSPTFRHGHSLGVPREDEWTDDSPAEQAILNVDFEAFLATLDDRRRTVAELLASGLNTADVGRIRGVTRAAIHYVRKDLIEAWREFFGDEG